MKADVSGSSIDQAEKCAPSAVLAQVKNLSGPADFGSAGHEHMEMRVKVGVDEAMARLPRVCWRWGLSEAQTGILTALLKHFEWTPPKGAATETSICLMADGSVQRVHGGRGEYDLPPAGLYPMTIDVMWSEPEPLRHDPSGRPNCPPGSTLFVVDYKFGLDAHVSPVEQNGQALSAALLAARYTGAEKVVPVILYVRRGKGDWDTMPHWLGLDELSVIEEQVLEIVERVRKQRLRYEARQLLAYVEGEHCRYCRAQWICPAKTALLKAFLAKSSKTRRRAPSRHVPAKLSATQRKKLAAMLPQLVAFTEQVKAALEAHVESTGEMIPLSGGRVWGPYQQTTTKVIPKVALPILYDELGEDLTETALDVSRTRIEEAVKVALEQDPECYESRADAMRQIMGRIGSKGGLVQQPQTRWGAHRPKETP